jgi:hypothetical protein
MATAAGSLNAPSAALRLLYGDAITARPVRRVTYSCSKRSSRHESELLGAQLIGRLILEEANYL